MKEKHEFISENKEEFEVKIMCEVLEVSKSGYYDWSKGEKSNRDIANEALLTEIKQVYEESHRKYGSPRVYKRLQQKGVSGGLNRIARLMRQKNVVGVHRRKGVKTTQSDEQNVSAPNLLKRQFEATKPNQKWLTDITYIPLRHGWLYLAVVMDLFSRRIIGWAMMDTLDTILPLNALKMAFFKRQPAPQLLHHSDRGCQYTSLAYQQLLADFQCQVSMSRKANCWDNAPIESFFATLKTEWLAGKSYPTIDIAKTDIFAFIEGFYNTHRLHSSLGYLSPVQFELFYYNSLF